VVVKLLSGEFTNILDDKGRLSLPAHLREDLPGSKVVLTRGIEKCIWVFPQESWMSLVQKIMDSTSIFHADDRLVQRRFIAPSMEAEIDKLGRVMIPQNLRVYAGLSRDCEILGNGRYIEIWNAESYSAYLEGNDEKFVSAFEKLNIFEF
jgi:MraZ protein